MADQSPYDKILQADNAQAARASMQQAAELNPDTEAKLQGLARQYGMPVDAVRFEQQDVERRAKIDSIDYEKLARERPSTSGFLSDPRRAAIAHDDVQNLADTENALRSWQGPKPSFASISGGFVEALKFKPLIASMRLAMNDLLFGTGGDAGDQVRRADLVRKAGQAQAQQDYANPAFETSTGAGLYSGGISLLQNLPGIAASIMTGSPAPGLALAGVNAGVPAYGKYAARGATAGEATAGAMAEGAVEVATEALPMGFLVKNFGRIGAGQFLAGMLGREIPSEIVATVTQNMVDAAIANPDVTMSDYLKAQPDAIYQTILATLVQGGVMGGVSKIVQVASGRAEQARMAEEQAARVEAFNQYVAASKVLQRDPETFQSFISEMTQDGPVPAVFIDAQALLQSGVADQVAAASPSVAQQLETAAATGGQIAIPVDEYASRIAATDAAPALLDHLKTDPEGFSRAEAQAYMQEQGGELQAEIQRVLEEQQAADTFKAQVDVVRAKMLEQLNAAGRFTPQANESYASLVGNFYAVQAARLGITPDELYQRFPLTVSAQQVGGQQLEQGPRGAFSPESWSIALLKDADLSTFLHEMGHASLEMQTQLSSQLAAIEDRTAGEQELIADSEALMRWFGLRDLAEWQSLDFEERRAYHEKFARGFEAYLFEGKAPSIELQGLFQRFRAWLLNIYRDIKRLNVELSDEVRGVMDRMLATNEQIQLAEQGRSMMPLFRTAEQAGMTPEEFAAYQALGIQATADAIEDLQARGMRDLQWIQNAKSREMKRLQKEADVQRAQIRMEVRREVMSQPVYRAWQFLTGKAGEKTKEQIAHDADVADWSAARSAAEEQSREDLKAKVLSAYPESKGIERGQILARNKRQIDLDVQQALLDWEKSNPKPDAPAAEAQGQTAGGFEFGRLNTDDLNAIGIPKEIVEHVQALRMTSPNGLHPDIVADLFGFTSGDELVRTLAAAPSPKDEINALTDQRMLERFGELATPDAIARAADAAIHNAARGRMLATEANALAKATGQRKILADAARQFAAAMVARLKVRDVRPGQYASAEAKAARAAQKASQAGDIEQAAAEKRNELVNHYATRAAYDAQDEIRATLRNFSEFANRPDKRLGKAYDLDIANAARAILGEYGIAERRAKKAGEYLKAVESYDPELYGVLKASLDAAEANAKPVQELTVEELRGLRDEIDVMLHLARRSRQMEADGDLIDRQEVEAELFARLEEIGIPDTIPGEGQAVTPTEARRAKLRTFVASARRVESWAGAMDGGNGMGPFRRFVFARIKDAADAYRADKAAYLRRFRVLFDGIAPTLKPQLIAAPELGYTFGKDSGGSAMNEILHALLHTGNASNKRKLLLGRGWAQELPDGTLDTSRWDAFVSRMAREGKITKAHMDFAQGVWDLLEDTKAGAQRTHRDVFGRYFDEVTAEPVPTPWGEYRGGYVPAMADSRVVQDANLRALAEEENAAMAYAFPTTPKGFTKARVEYNRPLTLDLRTLAQHIDKVLLFTHMEMPVRDVQRVLSKKVGQALSRVDPEAIPAMIQPWLSRSARQQVETPIAGSAGLMRFFSVMRARAGAAAMFANVSNAAQQITGFALAAVKVRPGLMLSAAADYLKAPREVARTVAESSPYMASRMDGEVAVMTGEINDILLNPSPLEQGQNWAMRHAYFLQSAVDNVMGPIIWTAAYNQALEAGESERDAVRLADATIRETQGSSLPEDISRIEGGNTFVRLFTQFAGYFNMQANLIGGEFVKIARDGGLRQNAGRGLFVLGLGFLAPAIVAEAIAQLFRGGPDDADKDGEYLDDWIAALFGWAPLRNITAMVPVVGQGVNALINAANSKPYDDRLATSPAVSMLESAARAPFSAYRALAEDGSGQKAVRDVATLISMTVGLPANLAARPVGYLTGVAEGRIDPAGPVDAVRGTLTGAASPESKR